MRLDQSWTRKQRQQSRPLFQALTAERAVPQRETSWGRRLVGGGFCGQRMGRPWYRTVACRYRRDVCCGIDRDCHEIQLSISPLSIEWWTLPLRVHVWLANVSAYLRSVVQGPVTVASGSWWWFKRWARRNIVSWPISNHLHKRGD